MVCERSGPPELEFPCAGAADRYAVLRAPAGQPGQGRRGGGSQRLARAPGPDTARICPRPGAAGVSGPARHRAFAGIRPGTGLDGQAAGILLELGKGFAFVAQQQRISTASKDFYIDLVFYNYLLKCFVLFDLKTGDLAHQNISQMDMYVRMYDELKTGPEDNPTVGIILCSQKDASVVRYSVLNGNEQLFASRYKLVLPSEEELRWELDRERASFMGRMEADGPTDVDGLIIMNFLSRIKATRIKLKYEKNSK